MASALEIVQRAYQAFGKGVIATLLSLVADRVDWKFCGPKKMPYSRACKTKDEVAKWFASIPTVDDIKVFEPREFTPAGEHVTILGWEKTAAITVRIIERPVGCAFSTFL